MSILRRCSATRKHCKSCRWPMRRILSLITIKIPGATTRNVFPPRSRPGRIPFPSAPTTALRLWTAMSSPRSIRADFTAPSPPASRASGANKSRTRRTSRCNSIAAIELQRDVRLVLDLFAPLARDAGGEGAVKSARIDRGELIAVHKRKAVVGADGKGIRPGLERGGKTLRVVALGILIVISDKIRRIGQRQDLQCFLVAEQRRKIDIHLRRHRYDPRRKIFQRRDAARRHFRTENSR